MSLHYLVKLAHCTQATVELLWKETPQFIPPQLCPPHLPDLTPIDNIMWEVMQEKVYKTRTTALELSAIPLTNGFCNGNISQL